MSLSLACRSFNLARGLAYAAGLIAVLGWCYGPSAQADDWLRFRGPNGTGVANNASPPTEWSDGENLKWKVELPGPGASSPIVVGNRVFVTCYSGYGANRQDPGKLENLVRHLVCVDRTNGELLWSKEFDAEMPEDPYSGAGVPAHGYASNTPVSDGEKLYVFFGKSGVYAFDFDGNQLWHADVGKSSGRQKWGSGASPILYDNIVIVNASDESQAVYGLDKTTGEQVWVSDGDGLANVWGTPIVSSFEGQDQVLLLVPYEVWSLDPRSGKLIWYSEATGDDSINSSLVPFQDQVIAMGERGGQTVSIRVGGKGDTSETNRTWSSSLRGRISTPVVYDGLMYMVSNGIAACIDAETGERKYQERLPTSASRDRGGNRRGEDNRDGGRDGNRGRAENRGGDRGDAGRGDGGRGRGGNFGGRGRGGFGGGRGGFGGGGYSSPVAADGKVYSTNGDGTVYVIKAGPEFELLATNKLESDDSGFNSTPAIVDNQILMRSNKYLYCIEAN